MSEFVSRLHWVSDVSPAEWVRERIGRFGSGVGGVLPIGFESYARILHPAWTVGGDPVRWAEVAAWSGRSLQAEVWFDEISGPKSGAGQGPAPWQSVPLEGELPEELLSVLCQALAEHTASRHGWFCLWPGWGGINGAMQVSIGWHKDNPPPPGTPTTFEASAAFPPEVLEGPRVQLPFREYMLFEGPIDAATELGGWVTFGPYRKFERGTPSLFWPEDHAWCVATEIDYDCTYVGGSDQLIHELLNHPDLEVLPATPEAAE